MTTKKTPPKSRVPARLTPEQAARHLNMTLEALARTRARGLAPGILGTCHPVNVLGFDRAVLDAWLAEQGDPAPEQTVDD